ncbi:TPA_asm: TRAF [Hydra MELD virus]|nr:TPA_asm: TRAF [Hydra MELD virus]
MNFQIEGKQKEKEELLIDFFSDDFNNLNLKKNLKDASTQTVLCEMNYELLISKVAKLEKVCQEKKIAFDHLLLVNEKSTFDGKMIWAIVHFKKRLESKLIAHSAPIHTNVNGYKFCMRLYFAGDGQGFGTHLSLFLVVMKGAYDDLLQWPFQNKTITFSIVTRKGKVDHQLFKPKGDNSVQKPFKEMGLAVGFPKFITIGKAIDYLLDDTLYISCVIDN